MNKPCKFNWLILVEFLSFSPTPSVNDTKKHRLPVEKPSLSVAPKNNLYQRWTELRSSECRKKQQFIPTVMGGVSTREGAFIREARLT